MDLETIKKACNALSKKELQDLSVYIDEKIKSIGESFSKVLEARSAQQKKEEEKTRLMARIEKLKTEIPDGESTFEKNMRLAEVIKLEKILKDS